MRKLLSVLFALTLALSLSTAALAETKAESAKPVEPMTMKADPAKKAGPAIKVGTRKAKSHQITGIVEAVDDAAGTLTVKGRRKSVSLKASDKVGLEKIRVGEKVLVHYRGDTAYSVKKVAARKAAPGKTAKKGTVPALPASVSAGK